MKVQELIDQVLDEAMRLGQKPHGAYRSYWSIYNPIITFFRGKGLEDYSPEVLQEYIALVTEKYQNGQIKRQRHSILTTAARRVAHFERTGTYLWNVPKRGTRYELDAYYMGLTEEFLTSEDFHPNTAGDLEWVACSMHSIKHNRLEAAILFAIQQQVHLAVSYSEVIARINSSPVKKSQSYRLNDLIAQKERELAKVARYKQFLYQDWKDGEITQQEYRDMKADYERQTVTLTGVLKTLRLEREELANGVNQEHPALVAFMKYQNIETLSREILVELVDHIKVYENGNISVKFKFADELRRIVEYIELNTEAEDTALVV